MMEIHYWSMISFSPAENLVIEANFSQYRVLNSEDLSREVEVNVTARVENERGYDTISRSLIGVDVNKTLYDFAVEWFGSNVFYDDFKKFCKGCLRDVHDMGSIGEFKEDYGVSYESILSFKDTESGETAVCGFKGRNLEDKDNTVMFRHPNRDEIEVLDSSVLSKELHKLTILELYEESRRIIKTEMK